MKLIRPISKVITISIVLIATIFAMRSIQSLRNERDGLRSTIEAQNATITTYSNQLGETVSQKQAIEIRARDLEHALPGFKEQLQREFDIKARNLKAYAEQRFRAEGSGVARLIPLDTANESMVAELTIDTAQTKFDPFALVVQDGYLDFHADVYDEFKAPYQYVYSDTMSIVFHEKRQRWYGPKKLYVSGKLKNKNAEIVGSDGILINECKKRFGVGPYVGYSLSGPSAGVSVHWSLIRF